MTTQVERPSPAEAFRRRARLVGLLAWGALVTAYLVVLARGASPTEPIVATLAFVQAHPAGAAAFVFAYTLRPLLFVSAALLTVGAGALWGPVLGFVLVTIGANAGAALAFWLGRTFGADLAGRALEAPRLRAAAGRLRTNAFDTVLAMRLAFVPFDAVSYLSGAVRLPARAFLVATALGSLPGTLVLLLFGAALGDPVALAREAAAGTLPRPDGRLLLVSALLLVVSLAASRLWRRRERARGGTT